MGWVPRRREGYKSGTSIATPHVTGVAALIRSKYPALDDAGMKAKLLDSVDKKGNLSAKTAMGGRLNGAGALSTTTITSGPSGTTNSTKASFGFSSFETGATFQCSLDSSAFEFCTSPKEYTSLSSGSHTFQVQAVDAACNVIAPTPASRTWTVDTAAPTVGTVTPPANGTTRVSRSTTVTATFSEAMNPSTLDNSRVMLVRSDSPTPVVATVSTMRGAEKPR